LIAEESSDKDGDPNNLQDSFEFHTLTNCLGCYKFKGKSELDDDSSAVEEKSLLAEDAVEEVLEVDNSDLVCTRGHDDETEIVASCEKSDKKIAPDSPEGQAMIRKEVIRLVSNLISSVNVHANEQGILRYVRTSEDFVRSLSPSIFLNMLLLF